MNESPQTPGLSPLTLSSPRESPSTLQQGDPKRQKLANVTPEHNGTVPEDVKGASNGNKSGRFPMFGEGDYPAILEEAKRLKHQGNHYKQQGNKDYYYSFLISGVLYLEYSLVLERYTTAERASSSYESVIAYMNDIAHALPAVLASLCYRCKAIALARQSLLSITLKQPTRGKSGSVPEAKRAKTMKLLESVEKLGLAHKEWSKSIELLPAGVQCSKSLPDSLHDSSVDEVLVYAKDLVERAMGACDKAEH